MPTDVSDEGLKRVIEESLDGISDDGPNYCIDGTCCCDYCIAGRMALAKRIRDLTAQAAIEMAESGWESAAAVAGRLRALFPDAGEGDG